jgi:hypothetical protein
MVFIGANPITLMWVKKQFFNNIYLIMILLSEKNFYIYDLIQIIKNSYIIARTGL